MKTKVHHTEISELSRCHLCCHWWHWRLSSRQPPVPPITTKLLSWQLLVFIHHNPAYPNAVAKRCEKQAYPWAITLHPPDPWLSILHRSGAPADHTPLAVLTLPTQQALIPASSQSNWSIQTGSWPLTHSPTNELHWNRQQFLSQHVTCSLWCVKVWGKKAPD